MAELDTCSVVGWGPKRGMLVDGAGAFDGLEDIGHELVSLKC